jgi:putative transposase
MARTPYPTDLTDEQWHELTRLIPPAKPGGRPRGVDVREVINGILYVLRTGCAWRALPHDLPCFKTCWYYFDRFSNDGTWRSIAERLHPMARVRAGRDPSPSEAIVDAQSVKTTRKGGRPARTARGASATTRASTSRAASGTWRSTRSGCRWPSS